MFISELGSTGTEFILPMNLLIPCSWLKASSLKSFRRLLVWKIPMDKSVDAVSCEPSAWGNCLVSAAGACQPPIWDKPSGLHGYGCQLCPWASGHTAWYPHLCTLFPGFCSLDVNVYKGARMSHGHWLLAPCFSK